MAKGVSERHTLKFTTSACTPARDSLPLMLKPYKIKNLSVKSSNETDGEGAFWQDVEVTVNKQAAGWVEYLILSSKKYTPNGKLFNEKNAVYAARRTDMPKAWIDSDCSKANDFKPKGKRKVKRSKNLGGKIVKAFRSIEDFLG